MTKTFHLMKKLVENIRVKISRLANIFSYLRIKKETDALCH